MILAVDILEKASIFLFMGIHEMDNWGLFYNNISDRLVHIEMGEFAPVIKDG